MKIEKKKKKKIRSTTTAAAGKNNSLEKITKRVQKSKVIVKK